MVLVKPAKVLDLVRRIVNLLVVRLALLLSTTITQILTPAVTAIVRVVAIMTVPAVRQAAIRAVQVPLPAIAMVLVTALRPRPVVLRIVLRVVQEVPATVTAPVRVLNHTALVLLIVEDPRAEPAQAITIIAIPPQTVLLTGIIGAMVIAGKTQIILVQVRAPDIAAIKAAVAERPLPAVLQTVAVVLARAAACLLFVTTARAV